MAAVPIAVVAVAVILLSSGSSYQAKAIFEDASQIVSGDQVEVAGNSVGTVSKIALTPSGQVQLTLNIDDSSYTPQRRGTEATVRQASLSGIASRYVDLRLGPGNAPKIASGGVISTTNTWVAPNCLLGAIGPFFEQLNPILIWLSNHQQLVSDFISQGGASLAATTTSFAGGVGHYLRQFSPIGPETLSLAPNRDSNNRGDTYPPPLWLANPQNAGKNNFPAWDCRNTGAPGDASVPSNGLPAGAPGAQEACWVAPAQPGAPGPSQNPHILAKSYPSK